MDGTGSRSRIIYMNLRTLLALCDLIGTILFVLLVVSIIITILIIA